MKRILYYDLIKKYERDSDKMERKTEIDKASINIKKIGV